MVSSRKASPTYFSSGQSLASPQSIGQSPSSPSLSPRATSPSTPGSTSIPSLKSLRSLLPFGPGKNAAQMHANSSSPNPGSRSPFPSFGGVRRSIQVPRDRSESGVQRNSSLNLTRKDMNASSPVISIGMAGTPDKHSPHIEEDLDSNLYRRRKRSTSLSGLNKALPEAPALDSEDISPEVTSDQSPAAFSSSSHDASKDFKDELPPPSPISNDAGRPMSLSPCPTPVDFPLILPPTDLSTIIEADTSGISKHLPSLSPSPSPSPSPIPDLSSQSIEIDLNVSASELTNEVREAMRMAENAGNGQPYRMSWLGPKPSKTSELNVGAPSNSKVPSNEDNDPEPILDHDNFAFELEISNAHALDPSLTALLSPNNLPTSSTSRAPLSSSVGKGFSRNHSASDSESDSKQSSNKVASSADPSLPRTPDFLKSDDKGGLGGRVREESVNDTILPESLRRGPTTSDLEAVTAKFRRPLPERLEHTQSQSPSPNRRRLPEDAPRMPPRRGSSASAGTAESWSPATSTVAYYNRRGYPISTAPPSPLSEMSSARAERQIEDADPPRRPRVLSSGSRGTTRPTRVFTSSNRPATSMGRTFTSGEAEQGTERARPATAMSRLYSGGTGRALRTPALRSPDIDLGSISGELASRRRGSLDGTGIGFHADEKEKEIFDLLDRHDSPLDRSSMTASAYRSAWATRRANTNIARPTNKRRSQSVDEDLPRSANDTTLMRSHHSRIESSSAVRPTHDWLGPRTMKAFKAAGLLDNKERSRSSYENHETSLSARRFASVRSTSDYSGMAHSSLVRSVHAQDTGSTSRTSASGTEHSPLGDSPTFTLGGGIRDRDVPRSTSVSTAPTSVSSYFSNHDNDMKEKEIAFYRSEISILKEKHTVENSALLGALSDSQRVARNLREENDSLRDRLAGIENDLSRLILADEHREAEKARTEQAARWRIDALSKENSDLRRQMRDMQMLISEMEQVMLTQKLRDNDDSLFTTDQESDSEDHTTKIPLKSSSGPVHEVLQTPTAGREQKERRFSTASSNFPDVPANMSMLMHDNDSGGGLMFDRSEYADSKHTSLSQSAQGSPTTSLPLPLPASTAVKRPASGHVKDRSIVSIRSSHTMNSSVSIAPTAESSLVSRVPGSPGSLFLSPEHENHLQDMESFELSLRMSEGDSEENLSGLVDS